MMNRALKITLLVVLLPLLLLLFAAGCAPESAPGKEDGAAGEAVFELTLAHFQPATHPVETVLIQGWIEALAEATGGRVRITSFPGGTLLSGTETFEGVVDGAADIGHSVYAYTRGRFPVIETFLTPGIPYSNAKVSDWVAMEGIKRLDPEELKGVKHLFTFSAGRGDLMTQMPIRTLEDLKGVEIGATAVQFADALRLLGAGSAVFTMPEQYEAVARGLTQGVLGPMEVLRSFRIAEAVGHVTQTPSLYNQLLFMVMNLETWNSLPEDIQQIIEEVTADYYKEVVAGFYDRLNKEVLDWMEQEKLGIEIITLAPEEKRRWTEHLDPMLAAQVANLEAQGFPGGDIMRTIQELTEKYNRLYGEQQAE
jgi:TRAP-type C4-dicarboxylate transport system substrate-binding protein